MVWGCMGWNEVGVLTEVQGIMNGEQYCKILDGGVVESFEKLEMPEGERTFQQDNDMKIFNSCLVKSPSNLLGVNLMNFPESTIIVHQNITHQHLNKVKADCLTSSAVSPKLIR